jgi:hypothetical protein
LKYPTLSSLAFAIFRSKFLKDDEIPIIQGELYQILKNSFTGGSVDVYKPRPEENEKVFRYDVNSLYPFVMKEKNMPIGNPIYFNGDILYVYDYLGLERPFGFFEVEIKAPDNMKIPLLQTKIQTKSGFRTIAPLGT